MFALTRIITLRSLFILLAFSVVSGCKEPFKIGVELLEKNATAVNVKRAIYFKLPLTQPKYHWVFFNRDFVFNNTELTLDVYASEEMKTKKYSFQIINDGKLSNEWEPISEDNHKENNELYFGFASNKMFEFTDHDYAILTFHVKQTLTGRGADFSGNLNKGRYVSSGFFSIFDEYKYDAGEDECVFLTKSELMPQWDLTVTSNKGWL